MQLSRMSMVVTIEVTDGRRGVDPNPKPGSGDTGASPPRSLPCQDPASSVTAMQVGGAVVLAPPVAGGPARAYAAHHHPRDRVGEPAHARRGGQPRSAPAGAASPAAADARRGSVMSSPGADVPRADQTPARPRRHRADLHPVEAIGRRDEARRRPRRARAAPACRRARRASRRRTRRAASRASGPPRPAHHWSSPPRRSRPGTGAARGQAHRSRCRACAKQNSP